MRSVLITGGSGSFGRAFVKRLLSLRCELDETNPAYADPSPNRICIYSRGEHAQALMRAEFGDNPRLRYFIGDVRDQERLRRAMRGCDTVIHAAALKRIEVGNENPSEMVRTNVEGAMNVIAAASKEGVEKVVALSTDKAYQPISPYGQTKALAESLFLAATREHGWPKCAVTRYGNVWKSAGSVVPRWLKVLEHSDSVPVSDPQCTRFMMLMSDAVDLVRNTAETMHGGELVIPRLPAYRLSDLAEAMGAKMTVLGLPPWEKLHEGMDDNNTSDTANRLSVDELKGLLRDE